MAVSPMFLYLVYILFIRFFIVKDVVYTRLYPRAICGQWSIVVTCNRKTYRFRYIYKRKFYDLLRRVCLILFARTYNKKCFLVYSFIKCKIFYVVSFSLQISKRCLTEIWKEKNLNILRIRTTRVLEKKKNKINSRNIIKRNKLCLNMFLIC